MKNVLKSSFVLLLLLLPGVSFGADWGSLEKDSVINGKVDVVKSAKKYNTLESCKDFANKRNRAIAFTLDLKRGTCTTFKSIRGVIRGKKGALTQRKLSHLGV